MLLRPLWCNLLRIGSKYALGSIIKPVAWKIRFLIALILFTDIKFTVDLTVMFWIFEFVQILSNNRGRSW